MTRVCLLEKYHGLLLSPPAHIGWLREREVLQCWECFPEEGKVGIVQDAVEHCILRPENSIGNSSFAFPAFCENKALREVWCQMGIVLLKLQFLLAAVEGLILPEKSVCKLRNNLLKKAIPQKQLEETVNLI